MTPSQYRLALDKISLGLAAVVLQLLKLLLRPGVSEARRKRVRVQILEAVWEARSAVYAATVEFLRGQAVEQSGLDADDVYVPAMRGYAPQSVDTVTEELRKQVDDGKTSIDSAAMNGTSSFVRHAEQAGRDAIFDAVYESNLKAIKDPLDDVLDDDDDYGLGEKPEPATAANIADAEQSARTVARPVAYARGLTGADNCAFCVMLASRGVVYKSAATAIDGPYTGRGGQPAYHNNCDCVAIPVYSSKQWRGKQEAERLYQMWLDTTQGFSGRDALNAFRRELDRMRSDGETIAPDIREAA